MTAAIICAAVSTVARLLAGLLGRAAAHWADRREHGRAGQ
jgi:hypothetical protein